MRYLVGLALIAVALTLMPRQQAPAFTAIAVLPNHSFSTIKLSDYAGKYVVLLFYPFDFTYVCPTEITSYSDKAAEFKGNAGLIQLLVLRYLPFQLTLISPISPGEKLPENKVDLVTSIFH